MDFRKFITDSFTKVKESDIPLSLYKDEMVKYNIIMYNLFANLYGEQNDKLMPNFAELTHSFMRVLAGSPNTQTEEALQEFLDKYEARYNEIIESINADEGFQRAKEDDRESVIIIEFIRMIGTASELPNEEHLRITDMFIMCYIIMEKLKVDMDYLLFLLDNSIASLHELAMQTGELKTEENAPEDQQ